MDKKGCITFRMVFNKHNLCMFTHKFAIPYYGYEDMKDKISQLNSIDGVQYLRYGTKKISNDRYVMLFEDFIKLIELWYKKN